MQATIMNAQTVKYDSLLPVIAFIAVMVFGIVGVARIVGWLPDSIFYLSDVAPMEVLSTAAAKPMARDGQPYPTSNARSKARCPECGVIVSMREIEPDGPSAGQDAVSQTLADDESALRAGGSSGYQFSVRLSGGAHRVIIAPSRALWRVGERVIIIDGTNAALP